MFGPPRYASRRPSRRRCPYGGGLVPIVALIALTGAGCLELSSPSSPEQIDFQCQIPESEVVATGSGQDGLPSLQNPEIVQATHTGADYLADEDRVIVLDLDGIRLAVPLNILWYHEVVNLEPGGSESAGIVVTHSALSGSSRVFSRGSVGGLTFGVSGFVYQNNLLLYERSAGPSLWQQMTGEAQCGSVVGRSLNPRPSQEMSWGAFRELHPDGLVLGSLQGYQFNYSFYPYGSYRNRNNDRFLYPQAEPDPRRPPKERVLGVPSAAGGQGVAFPFGDLEAGADVQLLRLEGSDGEIVVIWDAEARSAAAFHPRTPDGDPVTLRLEGSILVDEESGSVWRFDGEAVEGERVGERLAPVPDAHPAFWFAWAAFYPETLIGTDPES